MAFSRIKYDECNYKQHVKRSTNIGDYRLFIGANESINQCYSKNGPIGSKADVSMPRNGKNLDFALKADAESHLTNRILPHGECNDIGKNNKYKTLSKNFVNNENCNRELNSVDTRFTHPLDSYRGMNTSEYSFNPYLPVNPQCQYYTERNGTHSRLIVKDTFEIPETKILDKGEALPDKKPLKVQMPKCGVCGQN